VRLDVFRRLKPPASPPSFLLRAAWKYAVGAGIVAVVLTGGGVDRVPPQGHALATNVLPTTVPCGPIATDPGDPHTATWTAVSSPYGTGSTYNLPVNATNNPNPDPLAPPPCPAVVVPPDVTLKIDASQGSVHISSHGAALKVDGGHLLVLGVSETSSVLFDAEPDVASWDGIVITQNDATHRGNASFAYASIQNALNAITITNGATSTPDPTNLTSQLPYGLVLINSGIGPSYFDGIDSTNTPVLVKGRMDPVTQRADGKFGTVNNIGSQGIRVTFDAPAPDVTANALDIENVTFGSSVPFAATGCLPLQLPCSAGFIGNDAVVANFYAPNPPPVVINQSRFYRAGSFGVELNSPNRPVLTNNNFDCNGTGSPKPTQTCVGTGLKYSAIYLNTATVDLENSVTNNVGHEDGLDAVVLNGSIVFPANLATPKLTWKNATNDPANDHPLGYLLNGDLNLTSGTLVVPGGSVIKSKGSINLTGAALDASDTSDARTKVFTSLRDNVNIASCPSVFAQSCPSPLPAGEWGGISLVGSATDATLRSATRSTITNAAILYATTGVHILNGNSLTITSSAIGPTFADGVLAEVTPLAVTGTTFGCPAGVCSGPSNGNHGILADFGQAGPLAGGLKIGGSNAADGNTFQGSVNEAIRGVSLAGQTVAIQNNKIQNAGATGSAGSAGIYLKGADQLTLVSNDVSTSGTGTLHYPAIWLDGVSNADFNAAIMGNTGSGNGLDAIAFHGDTKALTWQTIGKSARLGYLVDGNLTVNGAFKLAGDYAPILGGRITVKSAGMTASGGAVLTSLREQGTVPSCGSVFVPRASGVCPGNAAGDWSGLVLDPGQLNSLTDTEIRYAATGITMDKPSTAGPAATNLSLVRTNIRNGSADGIATKSPLTISQGAFSHLSGRGIAADLSAAGTGTLAIDSATIQGTGGDGVQGVGLGGQTVTITNLTVDHAGAFGIDLKDTSHLTLTNNTVANSAASYPAIYLNGFTGFFANVYGNKGALNGVDAIALHGTINDDLTWQTARKSSDPTRLLGYVLDNTLTMQPGHTLTVNGGDIVKVGNGGLLNLQGVNLKADDTGISSQKVFTSLTDDTVGVLACHSAVVTACTAVAHAGDWGGIVLGGSGANATLVNAAVRYASTGILITSGASSTFGSSVFGLVVSGSSIGPTLVDGINAATTPVSVTTSSFSGGTHGISIDFTATMPGTPLRLSGNRFMSTSAEAILGQALAGQPVWITDNRIQGAGTYGIRLLNADQLVLRNNNVAASGGGPLAKAGRYPAIYLPAVSADFTGNIRGNLGSGNGLDALVFDGKVTSDLTWITPSNAASTHALGYLLDGGVSLQGGKLMVGPGDVVKSLGGPITINGGAIAAAGTATPGGALTSSSAIFTSLKDNPVIPTSGPSLGPIDALDAAAVSCPSVLASACTPGPGDWGGLVITSDAAGNRGIGDIKYGQINYANTGISLDSGPNRATTEPNYRLTVVSTTIAYASKDGINSLDTPFSVKDSSTILNVVKDPSTIQNVGANGIIASFFSPANCAPPPPLPPDPCVRLNVTGVTVTGTGKDGIVANGLGGQPTNISNNTITNIGTYGIRVIGADQLTLNDNTVNSSGGPAAAFRYPAIYLSGVKADFELVSGDRHVARNHGSGNGLDAMVIHGEASQPLTWLTTALAAPPVPADHFGYVLDGSLTVDGALNTNNGDVVKVLAGAINVKGALTAIGTTFTSVKDGGVSIKLCDTNFDSVFIQRVSAACPAAASGDWAGINVTGAASLTNVTIAFDDGLTMTGGTLLYVGGAMHDIAKNAIVVSGSPLSVSNVAFSKVGVDAIDSSNSGSADTITDDQFDHVTGVSINLQNSPADLRRNVFTNDGSPAVKTAGAAVTLQCSSIQSGGLSGDSSLMVKESDFAATIGVTAPNGASAENNWWGQATGPSGQLSGGIAVASYFATQNPSVMIAVAGLPSATQPLDSVRSDGSLGTGLVQATLTFSRNMNPEPLLPNVTYTSSPTPVAFSPVTGWKANDPRTWVGTAPITAALASSGTHTVSAAGAHDCVPVDPQHNLMTPPAPKAFVVDTTTLPNVSVSAPDLIGAGSARLHGHIDPNGWATGADQFLLTNVAAPFDQHTYATSVPANKTTPIDVTVTATGLTASATYRVQLQVPSANGTAAQPTADTVTLTGAASQLVFASAPPSAPVAAAPFSTTVTVTDGSAKVVSDFAGTVTVALTTSSGATLSGTVTKAVVNGVASFTNLSVNKTGTYTLTATSGPALPPVTSSSFTVQPGAAAQLAFTQLPTNPKIGITMSPAVTVTVQDSLGNTVTSNTSTITISLASNPASGTLSGTLSRAAVAGVATFDNLALDKAGTYTFGATGGGFTASPSSSITVT
jgi:hypothetical protein